MNRICFITTIFSYITFITPIYAQTTSPKEEIEKLLFSLYQNSFTTNQKLEGYFTPSLYYIIENKKSATNKGFIPSIIQSCQNKSKKNLVITSISYSGKNKAIAILSCQSKINKQYTEDFKLNFYMLKQNNQWLIDNIIRKDEVNVRLMIDREDDLKKYNHE